MVILAAFAAAAAQPSAAPVTVKREVRATVRILSAPPVRFQEIEKTSPEMLRQTRVRAVDGSLQTARLVEFQ